MMQRLDVLCPQSDQPYQPLSKSPENERLDEPGWPQKLCFYLMMKHLGCLLISGPLFDNMQGEKAQNQ